MRYKAFTFNMPVSIHNHLKMFVGNKKMSKFVTSAVEEKLEKMEIKLKQAYIDADKDKERNKEIKIWKETNLEDWK
ncbi:hypothetical protein ACFL4A_04165 [bacterium]